MNLQEFYDRNHSRYGSNDPRGLGWRDDHSQLVRFKVLSEVADLNGKSVLDEGCGFGDLYPFLKQRFPDVVYKGVDINPNLIAEAKRKYPEAEFEIGDFSNYRGQGADYILASGTFTFRIADARDIYFAQIARMFRFAQKGVAFNMLDALSYPGDETYITYTIPEVYDFCVQLTNKMIIRHDYSPEDFTFHLYH